MVGSRCSPSSGRLLQALAAVDMPQLIRIRTTCPSWTRKSVDLRQRVVLKSGRFGPFIACSKYPDECTFTRSLKKDKVPTAVGRDLQGVRSPMVIKTGASGVLACTTYPKCKHTRPVPLGSSARSARGDLASAARARAYFFGACATRV